MSLLRRRRGIAGARSPESLDHGFDAADLIWAVGSVCNLHRKPFEAALIRSQFPPPHTTVALIEALGSVGFDAHAVAVDVPQLVALPQPCLVVLAPRSPKAEANDATPMSSVSAAAFALALVVKVGGERVLYFRAGTNTPAIATAEEFAGIFAGVALAVVPAERPARDDDPVGPPAPFGFRWFVPELIKHRVIWRDVLLASLCIQLIALCVPLCSQIIIDKVIVHETSSTLVVIAIALTIFLLFSAGLGWIRQYLVAHTGNRVDAVLAMHVFTHLFRLPLRYFERRATGVVAARLHGVETIREFLSGAAVTLLLDCPFLVLFLALMVVYSAWLTLVTIAILAAIVAISLAVAPMFQERLNQQFLLGARNQAFLTEFIAGMETVK